ncbi:hypothetical protein MPSEU_000042400 [Mayamaea pseudoterrestris]|nr:hypothetical protein MPSEU_000042400 [Mayamaea pseudoterrestris]
MKLFIVCILALASAVHAAAFTLPSDGTQHASKNRSETSGGRTEERSGGNISRQQQNCSSFEQAVCNTKDLEAVCAAVAISGMGSVLDQGNWTIFAPTNEAFEDVPQELLLQYWDDLDAIKSLLLYHTIPNQTVYASDLQCGQSNTMGNGQTTQTVCRDDDIYIVGAENSRNMMPEIDIKDVEFCNGVVHGIDHVLIPSLVPTNETTQAPTAAASDIPSMIGSQVPSLVPSSQITTGAPSIATSPPVPGRTARPRPSQESVAPSIMQPSLVPSIEPSSKQTRTPRRPAKGSVAPSSIQPSGRAASITPSTQPVSGRTARPVIGIRTPTPSTESYAPSGGGSMASEIPSGAPSYGASTTSPTITSLPSISPISGRNETGNCSTVQDLACGSAGYKTLCRVVKASGLGESAPSDSGNFTIFAPNDEAFASLPHGTLEDLLEDVDDLKDLLLYHVVMDETLYSSVLHCTHLLQMANDHYTRTVCRDDAIYQKGRGNSRHAMPKIVKADIANCGGVIHEVDHVLLP